MTTARVSRGRKSEDLLAEWYGERGWPSAERTPAGLPGRDITGMPGLAPEVKARKGFSPLAWTRQAHKNADMDMPFVVLRCNGQGEAQIAEWLVIRTLLDDTNLLLDAGYGTQPKPWQGPVHLMQPSDFRGGVSL
jgi:hypothetical protein